MADTETAPAPAPLCHCLSGLPARPRKLEAHGKECEGLMCSECVEDFKEWAYEQSQPEVSADLGGDDDYIHGTGAVFYSNSW